MRPTSEPSRPRAGSAADPRQLGRREQGAQTRETLLDAAAIEFERRGVAGTRIEDVAQRASVTRGALYFHFKTVENMARVILENQDDIWPDIISDVRSRDLRGLAAVRELSARVVNRTQDDLRMRAGMLIAGEMGEQNTLRAFFQRWQDALIPLLQQAIADREISDDVDIRVTAAVVVQAAWGVLLVAREFGTAGGVGEQFDSMWVHLLQGLQAGQRSDSA